MSKPASPEPRRPLRRAARFAARAGLAVVVLAAAAYVLRGPLFGRMVAARITGALAAEFGGTYSLAAVEGGWMSDVVLVGLRTETPPPTGALRDLRFERASVTYSLMTLLRDPVRALRTLNVEGLRVVLDTDAPRPESADVSGAVPGATFGATFGDALAALPRPAPEIDVRASVLVRSRRGNWEAGAVHVRGGGTSLAIDLSDVRIPIDVAEQAAGRDPTSDVPGPLRLHGTLSWDEPGVVRFASDDAIAGVTLTSLTATAGEDGAWKIDARAGVAGGAIAGVASARGFEAVVTDLDLKQLPAWVRSLLGGTARYLPQNGRTDARISGDQDGLRATVGARDLGWSEHAIDRLSAAVTWCDGRLEIHELDATGDGVTLSARDVSVVPSAPIPVTRVGELSASTADVGALAARLGLADLALRLPPRLVTATVRVRSAVAGRIDVDAISIDAGSSKLDAAGTMTLPADPAAWRDAALSLAARATVSLEDARRAARTNWVPADATGTLAITAQIAGPLGRPRADATIDGTDLLLGGQRVDSVSASAAIDGTLVSVARLDLTAPFATVRASGTIDIVEGSVPDALVDIVAADLAAASLAFPALPKLGGSVTASARLAGTAPNALRGELTVRGSQIVVLDWNVGTLDIACHVDGPRVAVDRLRAVGPLGSVTATGTVDLATGAFDVPACQVQVPDLLAVTSRIADVPRLEGAVEVDGALRRAPGARAADVEGELRIVGRRLVAAGASASDLTCSIRARARHFEIDALDARGDFGAVSLAGDVDLGDTESSARLRRLEFQRGGRTASITAPVDLRWTADTLDVGAFEATSEGIGRARGSARIASDLVEATLDLADVDLSLFSTRAAGRATVHVEVTGPRAAPEGRVQIAAPSVTWDGEPASVAIDLTQDARGIRIDRLDVDAGDLIYAAGSGTAPWRAGWQGLVATEGSPAHLAMKVRSARPAPWLNVLTSGRASADAVELSIVGDGRDLTAEAAVTNLRWAGSDASAARLAGATSVHLEVRKSGSTAWIENAPGGVIALRGDVRTSVAPDWTNPVGAWSSLRDAAIEGKLEMTMADLSAAAPLVPELRYLAGRARGELGIGGTVTAPEWRGQVALDDVTLLLSGDIAPIDRGTAVLRLEGRRILIEKLTARLGSAPVTITGHLDLAGATTDADPRSASDAGAVRVNLHVVGANVLLVRSHHLRLRADVDLVVEGDLAAPAISGSLTVTRALYTRPMDILGRGAASPDQSFVLFSLRDGPLARATFDVKVVADNTVRVENHFLDAEIALDIGVRGTGEVPEPTGTVTFHGAKVTLPFTTLDVERGQLEFQPGNPFRPMIRAVARSTVKGYELNVAISGNLPDARVNVASSPALSQANARLLLATGATPAELETSGIAGTALARAGTLLGGAALSWVRGGSTPRGESVMDRVKLEVGREQSDGGTETVTAELRLAEQWYLVAERDRFEDYDMGIVWRFRFR